MTIKENLEISDCPEHDKMHLVKEKSQVIGEFLEWLESKKKFSLCLSGEYLNKLLWDRVENENEDFDDDDYKEGRFNEHYYYPSSFNVEKLLAEFFDIDLDTIEKEKQKILKNLRK